MDKPRATPKDFFLWAGAMIALYVSVFAFVALIFDYLNYAMPDTLMYYGSDPYSSGISYEMASLIVLFPLFLILMRIVRRSIERDPSRADVWVRRWALYLTLFFAGFALAGDLIYLVMYFFNGDVTLRFGLKVLVILLVAGGGFLHFLADLRDYWQKNPRKSRLVGYATGLVVLATIVAGFFIVGTPWQARLYRYDDQKVSGLEQIQSQIITYWQAKEALPQSLADLNDPLSGFSVPVDPQTGAPYEYARKEARTFELCATFNAPAQPYSIAAQTSPIAPGYPVRGGINESWDHGAGRVCFERTVDPDRYPPFSK